MVKLPKRAVVCLRFIKEAIKKPGALRKSLGVKKGEKIPASKLAKAARKMGVPDLHKLLRK
jgi:hypothetical protein